MSSSDYYDVCMVFPAISTPDTENKSFSPEAIHIVQKIYSKFGKHNLKFYVSVQKDEILVLIRITESLMREYANRNEYLLLADATELEARSIIGWPESNIRPIEINHDINITKYNPYQYIYLPFKSELPGPSKDDISVLQKLYTVYNQDTHQGMLFYTLHHSILYRLFYMLYILYLTIHLTLYICILYTTLSYYTLSVYTYTYHILYLSIFTI